MQTVSLQIPLRKSIGSSMEGFLFTKIITLLLTQKNCSIWNNIQTVPTKNAVKNCGDGLHVRDSLVSATEKCSSYDKNRYIQRHLDVAKQKRKKKNSKIYIGYQKGFNEHQNREQTFGSRPEHSCGQACGPASQNIFSLYSPRIFEFTLFLMC